MVLLSKEKGSFTPHESKKKHKRTPKLDAHDRNKNISDWNTFGNCAPPQSPLEFSFCEASAQEDDAEKFEL